MLFAQVHVAVLDDFKTFFSCFGLFMITFKIHTFKYESACIVGIISNVLLLDSMHYSDQRVLKTQNYQITLDKSS